MSRGALFACDGDAGGCLPGLRCNQGFCVTPDACVPTTCQMVGATCGAISNGCGGVTECGSCLAPDTCGGGSDGGAESANTCGCSPISDAVACQIAGRGCGPLMANNGCGIMTQYSCGAACPGDGGFCIQETSGELCAAARYTCGTLGVTDRCEVKRLVNCGGCGGGSSCRIGEPSDGGLAAACGMCDPENDATLCNRHGANCGMLSVIDNCGGARELDCGATQCDIPLVDGGTAVQLCGATQDNQCMCQPVLAGCKETTQCCGGQVCRAGLCCIPTGGMCNDDAECCGTGVCEAVAHPNGEAPDGGARCTLPKT